MPSHTSRPAASCTVVLILSFAASAHAAVTISSKATKNITCSSGVCTPTATAAVLNVGDLETLLASGNVAVMTAGSGGIQAGEIDIAAPFGWSATTTLTLDAYESVAVQQTVSVTGEGGLTVKTNDGGSGGMFSFGGTGQVLFSNLSSALTIDGAAFTLVGTISALATDVAANPAGNYALAGNYDASGDGTYTQSPVTTTLTGTFEGLGNTISNVSIQTPRKDIGANVGGLFSQIAVSGSIRSLGMALVSIGTDKAATTGGLAGLSEGQLIEDHTSGIIRGNDYLGGLVGGNEGTVDYSYSTVKLDAKNAHAGGLVGGSTAVSTISNSFAAGDVTGDNATVGGLIGADAGSITNSYASGAVTGTRKANVGGLIGWFINDGNNVTTSYSTGHVEGENSSTVGGSIGLYYTGAGIQSDCYWDTTTSGTDEGTGSNGNVPGITGLTTAQLQSGLPTGFDPTVWAQSPKINKGFPYLIANPPPK